MDWEEIKPRLQAKLDPAHIKPAPRGKFGDYVDGHHVISEANRIFGEDGWSYEITRLELVSEQTVEREGNNGPYSQYRCGYLCAVKVYVNGSSFKEGSAVGSGMGSPDTLADHHESAVKEAETDALKRALRSYGNTFGLALYDKTRADVGVSAPPEVIEAARGAMTMEALGTIWTANRDYQTDPEFLKTKDTRKKELEAE